MLAKTPVAWFVVVVSQAIIFLQYLSESKFKSIPYNAALINKCVH